MIPMNPDGTLPIGQRQQPSAEVDANIDKCIAARKQPTIKVRATKPFSGDEGWWDSGKILDVPPRRALELVERSLAVVVDEPNQNPSKEAK